MKCSNCGKTIVDNNQCSEDGLIFCGTICRYDWRQKGKPSPSFINAPKDLSLTLTEQDMNFPVPIEGFEGRNLFARVGYWTGTKIHLDGKIVTPSKSKLFSRVKKYIVTNNNGQSIVINMHARFLDIIPTIEISGVKYQLARPLSIWEYIWIGIPSLLFFIGGALGGILGIAAVYSNSILIRKIKHWLPRYLITGGTSALAFILFLKMVLLINPFFENLSLKSTYSQSASRTIDILTSRVWTCKKVLDTNGNNYLDSANPVLGVRRYFKGDRTFSQVFSDGSKLVGFWQIDSSQHKITIKIDKDQHSADIIEISPSILRLQAGDTEVVNESD